MNNYPSKVRVSNHPTPFLQSASAAKELVNAAEREACEIIRIAELESQQIIAAAKASAAEEEQRQETKKRVSTLFAWRNAVCQANEDLISISELLARRILIDEISNSPDSIIKRIESANELIDEHIALTIEISDQEDNLIKESLEILKLNANLVRRPDLNQGEFRLKSRRFKIESSPHFHLQKLIEEFISISRTFKQTSRKVLSNASV